MAKSQTISKSLRAVERAFSELRRGEAVVLKAGAKRFLVAAIEGLTAAEHAVFLRQSGAKTPMLVLSGARVGKKGAAFQMKLPTLENLPGLLGLQRGKTRFPAMQNAPAEAAAAVLLMQLAELLPACLFVPLGNTKIPPGLLSVSVAEITDYEAQVAATLHPVVRAPLNLKFAGKAEIIGFRPASGGKEHYAIVVGDGLKRKSPLIRVHSSCYTGDLLGSLACDCGDQLHEALRRMQKEGGGILLYLMQEGRGIGLVNKLRAYGLQAEGMDTVEANRHLGFGDDDRLFEPAVIMLRQLNVRSVRLLTNNPRKVNELEAQGIKVEERVALITAPHTHTVKYLAAKSQKLGHILPK